MLHITESLKRSAGGTAQAVQGLVAAECARGLDSWVFAIDGSEPSQMGVRNFNQTISNQTIKQFSVVHIHGIWKWGFHRIAAMCRRAGVRYVISPHGMLEPWSLRQKGLKKRIARFVYQDRDLRGAAVLRATAASEAEHLRALGFGNRIVVVPNGVNVPEGEVEKRGGGGQRRALFVGRMHPQKGVLELVESWARIKQSNNQTIKQWSCELVYTVSGDTEKAYERKVKERVLSLGMSYVDNQTIKQPKQSNNSPDFILTGPLDDKAKWDAYARADLFVLPTYTENFGLVVAEALWAGVPAITTKGAPWAELECSASSKFKVHSSKLEERCGWWIEKKVEKRGGDGEGAWPALDAALCEACGAAGVRALPEMGARGRKLVEEKYMWSAVAEMMEGAYEVG